MRKIEKKTSSGAVFERVLGWITFRGGILRGTEDKLKLRTQFPLKTYLHKLFFIFLGVFLSSDKEKYSRIERISP